MSYAQRLQTRLIVRIDSQLLDVVPEEQLALGQLRSVIVRNVAGYVARISAGGRNKRPDGHEEQNDVEGEEGVVDYF